MDVNPRECMFCHGALPKRDDEPVNLAFLGHIQASVACRDAFDVWTGHMHSDFKGD